MPTPGIPPSNFWNRIVDNPIVQSATYRFTKADRAYIDSQIRAVETLLLQTVEGELFFAFSQNVSAGGTVAAGFDAGIGIVTLTGTPGSAFTFTLPAGPGQYEIVNTTSQVVTLQIGSSTKTLAAGSSILVTTDGTTLYSTSFSPNPVLRLNAGSASKQIVVSSPDQSVNLDTSSGSGGAFVALMPVGAADGQKARLKDLSATGTCTWDTTPAQVSVLSGTKIEDPSAPGTFHAGPYTLTLPAAKGGVYSYEMNLTETAWKICA